MKKRVFAALGLLALTLTATAAAVPSVRRTIEADFGIQVVLDGETLIPRNEQGIEVEPFAVDGTTYLPIRAIGEALGLEVSYDEENNLAVLETREGSLGEAGAQYTNVAVLGLGVYRDLESLYGEADSGESAIGRAALEIQNGEVDSARTSLSNFLQTTLPQMTERLDQIETNIKTLKESYPGAFMESVLGSAEEAHLQMNDVVLTLRQAAGAAISCLEAREAGEWEQAEFYDESQLSLRQEAAEIILEQGQIVTEEYNGLYQSVCNGVIGS